MGLRHRGHMTRGSWTVGPVGRPIRSTSGPRESMLTRSRARAGTGCQAVGLRMLHRKASSALKYAQIIRQSPRLDQPAGSVDEAAVPPLEEEELEEDAVVVGGPCRVLGDQPPHHLGPEIA